MASRGGVGVDIDAGAVPQREDAMKPFEIMVSESQERMVAVVEPDKLDEAMGVCTKWGLRSTVIGTVTDTGRFVVRVGHEVHADMPAATLAHDAPIYDPPAPCARHTLRGPGVRPSPSSTCPSRRRRSARSSSACWQPPISARDAGYGSSTTTRS